MVCKHKPSFLSGIILALSIFILRKTLFMKQQYYLLILLSLFFITKVSAQTENKDSIQQKWDLKGISGINLSQTAMSNWAAGGENAIASNIYLNGSLTYTQGNWLWANYLALDYGLSKTKSQGMRKSTDKISFSTQLGYSIDNGWYYTFMGDLNTQFTKGYNYPDKSHYISTFFAPAYSNLSIGMEYRKKNYSVFFSPLSAKMTFVADDYLSSLGTFGVKPGKHFKMECGAFLKGRTEFQLMENVNVISTANLFTPYSDQFGNIDIDWDVLLNLKINKFLSATINTTLKYDNDIKTFDEEGNRHGAKVQFKEILGIGFAYNF